MQTIAINQNNDIFIDSSGNIALKNDIEALADMSKNKVLETLGESQYNQLEGIPYFETIFCDTPKIDLFQAAVIQTTKNTEDVINVKDFNYTQNSGVFSYTVTIVSDFGDIQLNG